MNGSTFLLLLRLGLSLAIVLGLVWGAARVLRSRGAMSLRPPGSNLEVVERRPVGKSASVALVRVGGQALLLGVTESRVDLLRACPELDEAEVLDRDDVVVVSSLGDDDQTATALGRAATTVGDFAVGAIGADVTTSTRRTGSMGQMLPRPPRMSLMDALREMTVRRAASSPPPR